MNHLDGIRAHAVAGRAALPRREPSRVWLGDTDDAGPGTHHVLQVPLHGLVHVIECADRKQMGTAQACPGRREDEMVGPVSGASCSGRMGPCV